MTVDDVAIPQVQISSLLLCARATATCVASILTDKIGTEFIIPFHDVLLCATWRLP